MGRKLPIPEWMEQAVFVEEFRYRYPNLLLFHIPNGEYRNKQTAARLKKMGVLPGVPDLFIPKYRIFIEMKNSVGGKLSKSQKEMIEMLRNECFMTVIVANGSTDAMIQIRGLLKND